MAGSPLFDGQTLNGWDGDPRFWSVKDGAIYVEPTCEKPTGTIYLIWKGGEPGDFMLKFESKGTGNVNGGVQFRSYMTADDNVALRYPGRGGGGTIVGELETRQGRWTRSRWTGRYGNGGRSGRSRRGRCRAHPAARAAADAVHSAPTLARHRRRLSAPSGIWPARSSISMRTTGTPAMLRTVVVPRHRGSSGNCHTGGARPAEWCSTTFADQAARDSWFKKDDYNQFLLVAKGNVTSMFMNGHLISVFIDNDPMYFRSSGKIGLEVESTGAYFTKNIFLKNM